MKKQHLAMMALLISSFAFAQDLKTKEFQVNVSLWTHKQVDWAKSDAFQTSVPSDAFEVSKTNQKYRYNHLNLGFLRNRKKQMLESAWLKVGGESFESTLSYYQMNNGIALKTQSQQTTNSLFVEFGVGIGHIFYLDNGKRLRLMPQGTFYNTYYVATTKRQTTPAGDFTDTENLEKTIGSFGLGLALNADYRITNALGIGLSLPYILQYGNQYERNEELYSSGELKTKIGFDSNLNTPPFVNLTVYF